MIKKHLPQYDPAFWDTEIPLNRSNEKLLHLQTGAKMPDLYIAKDMAFWQNIPKKFKFEKPSLFSLIGNKPLVISFLAGGWNHYGKQHLETLKSVYQEIKALNGNLLVILNASYTDSLEMIRYFEVDFNIVVDPDNQIATKFGLYSETAPVWDRISGISEEVPVPATFVVNQSGSIIYHTIDEDFDKPFSPTEVLGAVFAAASRVPYTNRYRFAT